MGCVFGKTKSYCSQLFGERIIEQNEHITRPSVRSGALSTRYVRSSTRKTRSRSTSQHHSRSAVRSTTLPRSTRFVLPPPPLHSTSRHSIGLVLPPPPLHSTSTFLSTPHPHLTGAYHAVASHHLSTFFSTPHQAVAPHHLSTFLSTAPLPPPPRPLPHYENVTRPYYWGSLPLLSHHTITGPPEMWHRQDELMECDGEETKYARANTCIDGCCSMASNPDLLHSVMTLSDEDAISTTSSILI